MPTYQFYSYPPGVSLVDEKEVKWTVIWEKRWMDLNVEHSEVHSSVGLCRYYAFADAYNGVSQFLEANRPEESKRFFGGVVGEKISTEQLQQRAPDTLLELVEAMKGMGVTTSDEHRVRETTLRITGDRQRCKKRKLFEPLTEAQLKGTSRHTIVNDYVYLPNEREEIKQAIDAGPLYVAFQAGTVECVENLGEENGILRRYREDEDEKEYDMKNINHAVMGLGRGMCLNKETNENIDYVVGQNNWAGCSKICRGSFDAIRMCLTFDVRPIP